MAIKYPSFIGDPDIITPKQRQEYGIQTLAEYQQAGGSPHLLGNVDEGLQYKTTSPDKYTNMYQYYLGGGFDAAQEDFPIQAEDIIGEDGGSDGTGTDGTGTGTGGINTPFEQNLIDQGIGVQDRPGDPVVAPGEYPSTQAEMDAFNQRPVNTDYTPTPTNVGNPFGYGMTTSTGGSPRILNPRTYANTGDPNLLELAGGEFAGSDAGFYNEYPDYSDVTNVGSPFKYMQQTTTNPKASGQDVVTRTEPVNLTGVKVGAGDVRGFSKDRTTSEDDLMDYREHYDMVSPITKQPTTFPEQVDFDQGFIDAGDFSAPGTGADPREKMDYISEADAANPEGFLAKFGLDKLNVPEAILKTAINAAVGGPITLFIDMLRGALPPMDPRQIALNELYQDRTSAGTISSGLMKGYNPVSGGFLNTITGGRYGDETQYGMQEAYQDRIDTITKSLGKFDKYNPDHEDYDPEKAQQLIQRKADLEAAMTKEKSRLDLFSGDVDERDQMLEDIMLQNKIDAGIAAADEEPFPYGVEDIGIGKAGTAELDNILIEDITSPPKSVLFAQALAKQKEERMNAIATENERQRDYRLTQEQGNRERGLDIYGNPIKTGDVRPGGDGGGGQAAADVAGGSWEYSPFRKGGRVGYSKGGIVDLLK